MVESCVWCYARNPAPPRGRRKKNSAAFFFYPPPGVRRAMTQARQSQQRARVTTQLARTGLHSQHPEW